MTQGTANTLVWRMSNRSNNFVLLLSCHWKVNSLPHFLEYAGSSWRLKKAQVIMHNDKDQRSSCMGETSLAQQVMKLWASFCSTEFLPIHTGAWDVQPSSSRVYSETMLRPLDAGEKRHQYSNSFWFCTACLRTDSGIVFAECSFSMLSSITMGIVISQQIWIPMLWACHPASKSQLIRFALFLGRSGICNRFPS